MQTVGEMRRKANMTQAEIASVFDVALRTWQNWEAGRRMPHRGLLEYAFKALYADQLHNRGVNGPTLYLTTAERRDYTSGRAYPAVRRLVDGTWLDKEAWSSLPVGATFWETQAQGRWVKMIRSGTHADDYARDGEVAPFPPFDWRKHAKK